MFVTGLSGSGKSAAMNAFEDMGFFCSDNVPTVLIPEFVVRRWWEHILHNQTALFLKGRLLFREGVVVTSVPYHVRTGKTAGEVGGGAPGPPGGPGAAAQAGGDGFVENRTPG